MRENRNIEGFKDVIKPYQESEIIEILYKYGMKGEIYHCYKKKIGIFLRNCIWFWLKNKMR